MKISMQQLQLTADDYRSGSMRQTNRELDFTDRNVNLPKSVTSHSFRRGGAICRLWRAKNRLDIDELLAWYR